MREINLQAAIKVLEENRVKIIEEWETRARQEISAAGHTSSLVLRDHLGDFLNDLAQALTDLDQHGVAPIKAGEENHNLLASKAHGRIRAATAHFTIDQVIHEYSILRIVISSKLKESGCYNMEIAEIITRSVELGTLHSATEFSNSLLSLQQKIIATLSHDLRNPLQSNFLSLELLEAQTEREDLRPIFERSKANYERVDRMISELLNSIDVKAGQGINFEFHEVDLRERLNATKEEAEALYGKLISFNFSDEAITGYFDEGAVSRLIENLVSNAFKYGDPKKKVTVDIENQEKEVVIKVHNWGHPIPESEKKRIFTFLSQGTEQKEYKPEGWGIGLSIVDMVCKAHGGRVEIKSDSREGTTFCAFLLKDFQSEKTDQARPL